jgi:2-polyprenyl-6-methoxyphenol hydroxylase-like FAD-dependent oxidoreductase
MANAVVVGAGPLGATLAYLLARNGVDVTLLERQHDFARAFRGEVLMPSGVDALRQAGLGPTLDATPHVDVRRIDIFRRGASILELPLAELVAPGTEIRITPQPELLESIVTAAEGPSFTVKRGARVRDVIEENGRIVGVTAKCDGEAFEVRANIVIGADGRGSVLRKKAGLADIRRSEAFDIVWCKAPSPTPYNQNPTTRFFLGDGHFMICIPQYDGRLQIGWVIRKGGFGELHSRGIEHWVRELAGQVSEDLGEHLLAHADSVTDPFLLNVICYCLPRWTTAGLLLLGDAAHPMSPVGAQGLNVALRDALVAANHLIPVLQSGARGDKIDAAAAAAERERRPEIEQVQALQRRGPRLLFGNPAVLGAALRIAPWAAAFPPTRRLFRATANTFLNGSVDVQLNPAFAR